MPYHIGEEGSYGCDGYPVVKDSDGTVMGCHKTKEDAKKQLAALYINEPNAEKSAGHVPPQEVRSNAKRGLELRDKYNRGGTEVGVARARDLSNGAAISLDTINRMLSYFARHEVDKKGEGWGKDSAGYIAWLLWGGDAGWAWAKKVKRENESKEKSTMNDLTTAFFEIVKSDRNADGTMMVYGKATDDALDIDQQICDPIWLDRAMPEWFRTGGNIREQHSSIAAGVAKEYEKKKDGHYIHALVVDPVSVKKVDAGVLRGFSIGIKSPRVVRDTKAANGRIIDGQIVEVSLVDRPANPNCQLVLAKSVEGETGMWKVEELIEKHGSHNQMSHGRRGGSSGGGGGVGTEHVRATRAEITEARNNIKKTLQNPNLSKHPENEQNAALKEINTGAQEIDTLMADADKSLNEAMKEGGLDLHTKHLEDAAEALDKASDVADDYEELSSSFISVRSTIDDVHSKLIKRIDEVNKSSVADIEKHGSHNQMSHGRRGGRGGAGGGGGGSAQPRESRALGSRDDNPVGIDAKTQINRQKNEIQNARMKTIEDEYTAKGHRDTKSAERYLKQAQNAPTVREARAKIEQARAKIDSAKDVFEDQNYHSTAGVLYGASKELRTISTAMSMGLIKSSSITLQLHQAKDATEQKEILMKTAKELIEQSKSFATQDLVKFDQALFDQARQALAQLIVVEANEMTEGGNEEMSIAHLLSAVHHLFGWYDGEVAEGEVMSPEENIEMSAEKNAYVKSTIGCDCAGCEKCGKAGGCNDKMCKMHDGESMTKTTEEASDETPKSAETHKCLECGCGIPQDSHGRTDVSTATMVSPDESPKSAEAEEPTTEEVPSTEVPLEVAPAEEAPIEEEKVSDDDKLSEDINAIVEKAVKIATESLKTEINSLVSAKEAATEKAISLESELATAKSLAVAGGPRRTIKPIDHASNDLLVKAATYKAKADASTDPDLVKGYKALYQEFIAKANAVTESN